MSGKLIILGRSVFATAIQEGFAMPGGGALTTQAQRGAVKTGLLRHLKDRFLKARVKARLQLWRRERGDSDIAVRVHNGLVQLTGDCSHGIPELIRVVSVVRGVKRVRVTTASHQSSSAVL